MMFMVAWANINDSEKTTHGTEKFDSFEDAIEYYVQCCASSDTDVVLADTANKQILGEYHYGGIAS